MSASLAKLSLKRDLFVSTTSRPGSSLIWLLPCRLTSCMLSMSPWWVETSSMWPLCAAVDLHMFGVKCSWQLVLTGVCALCSKDSEIVGGTQARFCTWRGEALLIPSFSAQNQIKHIQKERKPGFVINFDSLNNPLVPKHHFRFLKEISWRIWWGIANISLTLSLLFHYSLTQLTEGWSDKKEC